MPQGKLCAQVAHASLAALFNRGYIHDGTQSFHMKLTNASLIWLQDDFTKVVVYVKSEHDLKKYYELAHEAGLPCSLIKDAGRTVFSEPTYTTCAIGPGFVDDVDAISGGLPLV